MTLCLGYLVRQLPEQRTLLPDLFIVVIVGIEPTSYALQAYAKPSQLNHRVHFLDNHRVVRTVAVEREGLEPPTICSSGRHSTTELPFHMSLREPFTHTS